MSNQQRLNFNNNFYGEPNHNNNPSDDEETYGIGLPQRSQTVSLMSIDEQQQYSQHLINNLLAVPSNDNEEEFSIAAPSPVPSKEALLEDEMKTIKWPTPFKVVPGLKGNSSWVFRYGLAVRSAKVDPDVVYCNVTRGEENGCYEKMTAGGRSTTSITRHITGKHKVSEKEGKYYASLTLRIFVLITFYLINS